ncbi:MAG: glycosyl transferase family 1, partial [Marinilabiliales bacterium]
DFDDSIWLKDVSEGNASLGWLKKPSKIKKNLSLSAMVFAGNKYLADYASIFNDNVKVVPTTIDTEYHKRSSEYNHEKPTVCVGWTGTSTTLKHFEQAVPIIERIIEKYDEKISVRLIVDKEYSNDKIPLKCIQWTLESEISDLEKLDIGIMPLPDDDWSNGKCGFKGLQYMALEIPTIMSPVGVNSEIIEDGKNGFLANDPDEWVEKISRLIEDSALRKKMGAAGRQTVIEKYSVHAWKTKYLEYFNEVIDNAAPEK